MKTVYINAAVEATTRAIRRATTQLAGACRSRNIYSDDVAFELIVYQSVLKCSRWDGSTTCLATEIPGQISLVDSVAHSSGSSWTNMGKVLGLGGSVRFSWRYTLVVQDRLQREH
jgi:hypothetical protein